MYKSHQRVIYVGDVVLVVTNPNEFENFATEILETAYRLGQQQQDRLKFEDNNNNKANICADIMNHVLWSKQHKPRR